MRMNRETLNRDEQTNNGAYARSSSNAVKHSPKSKTLWASATAGPTRLAPAERGQMTSNFVANTRARGHCHVAREVAVPLVAR